MTISRRDTILLAVLINVGLLALLFMTAIHENENPLDTVVSSETTQMVTTPPLTEEAAEVVVVSESELPVDELDKAIKAFSNAPLIPPVPTIEEKNTVSMTTKDKVEIVVKRGDTLDKIAKANKTTVEEIRKLNQLSNDKLSVGQKLFMPIAKSKKESVEIAKKEAPKKDSENYYTIKSGDSPWKIAKEFKINYEDILKLNNLTEEKARSLKVGEQIRIK